MYKSLCLAVVLGALVALTGCGRSPDALVEQQIGQMNEWADAIEAGADQAKIDAIEERLTETKKALEELDLSDAEKKKLAEKYGEELGKATARVMKASMSKMGGMMEGMMKGMKEGLKKEMPGMP